VSISLKRKPLKVRRLVGKTETQSVVDGSLAIPANQPAVDEVISIEVAPRILSQSIDEESGTVVIEGNLSVDLIYAAVAEGGEEKTPEESGIEEAFVDDYANEEFVPEQPEDDIFGGDLTGEGPQEPALVYGLHWKNAIPFTEAAEIDGIEADMVSVVDVEVENLDFNVESGGRSVIVDCVVTSMTGVYVDEVVELARGIQFRAPDSAEVDQDEVVIEQHCGSVNKEFAIQAYLENDDGGLEPAARILKVSVTPVLSDVQLNEDGILIEGQLQGTIMYAVDTGDEQTDRRFASARWTQEITQVIDRQSYAESPVPGTRIADPELRVVDAETTIHSQSQIQVTTILAFSCDLVCPEQVTLVTGISATGENEIEVRMENVMIENLLGRARKALPLEGILQCTDHPPIDEIFLHAVRPVGLSATSQDGRVSIRGSLELTVFYSPMQGESVLPLERAFWADAVPVEATVNLPEALEGAGCTVRAGVISSQCTLVTADRINLEAEVELRVRVAEPYEQREQVAEVVAIPPVDENPPSLRFVVVREGDSLWKLSRYYHTDIDAILAANKWLQDEDSEYLKPGWKICIPRPAPLVTEK